MGRVFGRYQPGDGPVRLCLVKSGKGAFNVCIEIEARRINVVGVVDKDLNEPLEVGDQL